MTKEEWREPSAWQESLRDGSFAVPTGTTLGPTATGAFCSVVRIGGAVYTAVASPVVLLLIVVALVSTAGVAARSTAWSPGVPHPLRRARSAGQIITSAAGVFRRRRWTMVAVGFLFLPAALLELALHQLVFGLTPLGDLADVAGRQSLVSVALALFVAGAGHVLAATVVVGGVAMVLDAAERGDPTGIRDAYAMLSRRAGRLLRTALRAGAIALGLAVTVVGIPWAIALLGRWAVAVQVTAIEGSGPGEALARSRVLVRGRWWRAAAIAATVNVIGAVSGPVVGIALLFPSDLPLATVNAVSSAVFVRVMPLVGAALAFLYGDLVARRPGPTPPPSAAP